MDPKIEHIEEDGLVYKVRTYYNGDKHWCYNTNFHRLTGPAIELANGYKEYYINNRLHRLNGPAVEYPDGSKDYYINGKRFNTFEEYKEAVVQIKIKEILNES